MAAAARDFKSRDYIPVPSVVPDILSAMPPLTLLITGCSSGIGLTCALGMAARGHRVLATARCDDNLTMLEGHGLEAIRLELDDSASITTAVDEAVQRAGRIDVLFNNAAYGQPGAVEDLRRDVLRAQFETNLFGTLELTNRVIPLMRAQGGGRIVMNSSVLGLVALPYRGAYNASKFALEGLSDTLRLELHGSGIEVSLIEPGPITSRFRENAYRMWQRHIDAEQSAHRETYRAMERRLADSAGKKAPFTLGPEAVLKALIHASESRRPKARYYVTVPTHLFAWLRRLLPHRTLDRVLRAVSRGENR